MLAVVLVREKEKKILTITKTNILTGKVDAEKVQEIHDNWSVTEKIIACGFDTTRCRHHILELVRRDELARCNSLQNYEVLQGRAQPTRLHERQ